MVRGRPGGDHADMETRTDSPTTTEKTTPRLITRSSDDRMLGGVCGGIARHLDVDPVIVRIATVALVCAVGAGIVAYLAAWILMPLDDEPAMMPSGPRPAHACPAGRQLARPVWRSSRSIVASFGAAARSAPTKSAVVSTPSRGLATRRCMTASNCAAPSSCCTAPRKHAPPTYTVRT